MREWAGGRFGARSFTVLDALPDFGNNLPTALIVVNAARDHEAVAKIGLEVGVPVLIEKPLALNRVGVNRLIGLAASHGASLAAGHALRFARYIHNYASDVASSGGLAAITVRWCDVRVEERYGELKSYDSSVPIFADCLPHVLSLIAELLPVEDLSFKKIQSHRGGSEVRIDLLVNRVSVEVLLARNAPRRQRWIEAVLINGSKVSLDFASEPGLINKSCESVVADTLWFSEQRPLASMLSAFVFGVFESYWDTRLSPRLALTTAELVDRMQPIHRQQLLRWARAEICKAEFSRDVDALDYALRELLQKEEALHKDDLNRRVQHCLVAGAIDVFN
jgi:predicted dehydrogenase